MKKILFILVVCIACISCNTTKTIGVPVYETEYMYSYIVKKDIAVDVYRHGYNVAHHINDTVNIQNGKVYGQPFGSRNTIMYKPKTK